VTSSTPPAWANPGAQPGVSQADVGQPDVSQPGAPPGVRGVPPLPPYEHQALICGYWPLKDALELGALPGAVPCARLHTRQVLWEWGLAHLRDNAELLISELVTNAIAADQTSAVRLWLHADHTRVLILVWDPSQQPPAPGIPDEDAESGRGLLLVTAVSQQWDWYFPLDTSGKVVWALVSGT
jgi:anti-sigma regulatory factor (Ser/Thr protein kinase)